MRAPRGVSFTIISDLPRAAYSGLRTLQIVAGITNAVFFDNSPVLQRWVELDHTQVPEGRKKNSVVPDGTISLHASQSQH